MNSLEGLAECMLPFVGQDLPEPPPHARPMLGTVLYSCNQISSFVDFLAVIFLLIAQ